MKTLTRMCLLATLAANGWGQMTLKGLLGVRVATVISEGNGTGAASEKVLTKYLELNGGSIQTETELRLRQGGMIVQASDTDSVPALVILVSAAGTEAVSVDIYLLESATLDRGAIRAAVHIWEHPSLLQVPTSARIREIIRDGISAFLNDWLASRAGGK